MQLDDRNGWENTLPIWRIDAANVLRGAASPGIKESHIRGLDLEMQELVRARGARSSILSFGGSCDQFGV